MTKIEAYELREVDGGGMTSYHLAWFATKDEAERIRNGSNWMLVSDRPKTLRVFDSADEYRNFETTERRRKALAKLSAEDRVALGFPDTD